MLCVKFVLFCCNRRTRLSDQVWPGFGIKVFLLLDPYIISPSAARSPITVMYHEEVLLESCLTRGCVLGDKDNDIISSSFHSCELPIDASVRPVPYYRNNITKTQVYVNRNMENLDRYRVEVETALNKRSLSTDFQRDEKIFRTILPKEASHHILTGHHIFHEGPVPAEILDVMTRRDDFRKRDLTSHELSRLNRDFVETMDQKAYHTKLWRTNKPIDGRAKRTRERSKYRQWNVVLITQAANIKYGQTYFFKRHPTSNNGDQEETNGDGT